MAFIMKQPLLKPQNLVEQCFVSKVQMCIRDRNHLADTEVHRKRKAVRQTELSYASFDLILLSRAFYISQCETIVSENQSIFFLDACLLF